MSALNVRQLSELALKIILINQRNRNRNRKRNSSLSIEMIADLAICATTFKIDFNYMEHDWWRNQILETIWYSLSMQYQVNWMNPTGEKGHTRAKNSFFGSWSHKLCWVCIITYAEHNKTFSWMISEKSYDFYHTRISCYRWMH